MKHELKTILTNVSVTLTIFMIGVVIYKQANPYAHPGLENRILFALVPSAIVLLYLYLEEMENRDRLLSAIRVTIGKLHESKFIRVCERTPSLIRTRVSKVQAVIHSYLYQIYVLRVTKRCPSLIRTRVSKVLAVVYTYLHKMSGYMLKQDPKQVVFYAFLTMLLIVALQAVIPQPLLEWARTPMMIAAVTLGVITFYLNKDKLGEIEDEAKQEEIEENRRKLEFGEKYPRINQVWGVRWGVRWIYKEGGWHSGGLIALVVLGFLLRIWSVGVASFGDDEYPAAYVAKSLLESHAFVLPTGIAYNRAWVNIIFTALSIKIFGFNEFSARLPSVIFGSLMILATYIFCKKIGSKNVAILSAFLICFNPWEIAWSREARMYAQAQFFYLIIIYLFYLAIEKQKNIPSLFENRGISISNIVKKITADINVKWTIIFFVFLVISFATHQLTILFVTAIYTYSIVSYIRQKQLKYLLIIFLFSFGILLSPIVLIILPPSILIVIQAGFEPFFINYLFKYHTIVSVTGLMGMYLFVRSQNKLILLVALSFITPLMVTTYLLDWNQNKYIYHLFPLLIIASSYFVMTIIFITKKNIGSIFFKRFVFILMFFIIFFSIPFDNSYQIIQHNIIDKNNYDKGYGAMQHPDWKGLKQMFSGQMKDEIFISTTPFATTYYFGRCDYWIRRYEIVPEYIIYSDGDGNSRSIYEGSIWIYSYESFMNITTNTHGYFVVDNRFNRYYVPDDIINHVKNNMTLTVSSGELRIYEWGH